MKGISNFYDHILLLDNYKKPQMHKHLAKHIIFCLDSTMELIVKNDIVKCEGICIDSNIEHTIITDSNEIIVYLIEKTSILSKGIEKEFLKGKDFGVIDNKIVKSVSDILNKNKGNLKNADKEILEICGLSSNMKQNELYDKRILEVLNIVDSLDGIYKNTIHFLSSKTSLSQSRLSHLFKENIGVSLAGYLVFQKMKKTYNYVLNGMTLTEASIKAGFDSSSHFSATCKRMFGLSFSEFYKKLGR